jgi:hypothetical protein
MLVAVVGSVAFLIPVVLYVLLVLGLPYGEFAMGGKYKVMPIPMRFVCAVSIIVQFIAIVILLQTAEVIPFILPQGITRGLCYFFAAYLTLNTFMNLVSKSKKEKYIMTPLSAVTAVCFWITAIAG